MDQIADYGLLAGRICLSAVFLYSAADKLVNWRDGIAEVKTLGLPLPRVSLALTITVQSIAGLMVLLGVQARVGAILLIGFVGCATVLAHPFWSRRGAEFRQSFTVSLEHLAMIGGFLMIAALGSGSLSLDRTVMP